MKIGVDLDSVLADLPATLGQFLKDTYGMDRPLTDYVTYDLSQTWNTTPERAMELVYEYYRSPYFDRIEPVPGAVSGAEYLSRNHSLTVITSRPTWLEDKTRNWVERYFGITISKVILTNQFSADTRKKSKSEVCIEENVELMIEDGLEYATDCAEAGIPTLLLSMPWNANGTLHDKITRFNRWDEITDLIQ